MELHHLPVSRTARYATLGDPRGPVRQVWFACHGYGQTAPDFLGQCRVLTDPSRYLVAPEALSRFYVDDGGGQVGASWMTREDRLAEIDDYVGYLDALYARVFERIDRDETQVFVLGFSQGAHTAARWITRGQAVRTDDLVLWGEMVPAELQTREGFRQLRALRLHLVYGSRDRYITPEAVGEQRARLETHGTTAHHIMFTGGHRLDDETLRQLAEAT